MRSETDLLARWPKQRPILPPAYAAIHREQYERSRHGRSPMSRLSLWAERWMHRAVAIPPFGPTLEIGPGTLNHLPFEPTTDPYDIVEPFVALYADSRHRHRIRHAYPDIRDVPTDARYARIISIATFEHLLDLPEVTDRLASLLAPGGVVRIAVPSEGEPLCALACAMTTGLAFRRRYTLDYRVFLRYEHVNTAREIEAVLRATFGTVAVRTCGPSRRWSLYHAFDCSSRSGASRKPGTDSPAPGC